MQMNLIVHIVCPLIKSNNSFSFHAGKACRKKDLRFNVDLMNSRFRIKLLLKAAHV